MYTQQCTFCAVSFALGKSHACELMNLTDALNLLMDQPEATTTIEYAWRLRVRVAIMRRMTALGAVGMARAVDALAGLCKVAGMICKESPL